MHDLKEFKFWCQKVLPLVYDDSLSYYEVLCKVVDYLNKVIEDLKETIDRVEAIRTELLSEVGEIKTSIRNLEAEIKLVQTWIDNFDTSYAEKIIKDTIATMIFVGINEEGYIVYYIPQEWSDITFNTTGVDTVIKDTEYGRLVLSY